MKKLKLLGVGVTVLFVVLCVFITPNVFADNVEKQITAWFNSIAIKVNGKQVQSDNFIYEGTTYVPLRAISELLGKEVIWDNDTRTVEINDMSEKDDFQGNSAGNFSNLGKLVGDENWIYLSYKKHVASNSDEDGLYKMKPDGSQILKIAPQVPQYLNLDGQHLYYAANGIYKADVNGTGLQKLTDAGNTLILAGDWLYFNDDDNNIWRMGKDGSDKRKMVEGKLVAVAGNRLYYTKDSSLFATDLASEKEAKLYSFTAERYSIPIVQRGKIYYTDYKSIYRLNSDGTNQETLYTTDKDNLFSINVYDGEVLVTEGNSGNHGDKSFVKIPLDGGAPQKSIVGGLQIFTAPTNNYVTDFSAGYHSWYFLDQDKRSEIKIASE